MNPLPEFGLPLGIPTPKEITITFGPTDDEELEAASQVAGGWSGWTLHRMDGVTRFEARVHPNLLLVINLGWMERSNAIDYAEMRYYRTREAEERKRINEQRKRTKREKEQNQ